MTDKQADSSLTTQTPEGIEFVLFPAGMPIRACALAIDWLIEGTLFIVILIAAGILGLVLGAWFMLLLLFILNWFYHTICEISFRGQSPGKRMMGIRVVRRDGSPVNPGASFLRNLLRFADTFMFLYLIVFICMAASPAFRRLGDWVADTLVVYTVNTRTPGRFTAPALRRSGMPWLAGFPVIYPSASLDYEEKQAILSFARRYPLLGKARADEIAALWAEKLEGASLSTGVAPNRDGRGIDVSAGKASPSEILLGVARAING